MSKQHSFTYTFPDMLMWHDISDILTTIWKEKPKYLYMVEHHSSNCYVALVELDCNGCKLPTLLTNEEPGYEILFEYNNKRILNEWAHPPISDITAYRNCEKDIIYFTNSIVQAETMFESKLKDIENILQDCHVRQLQQVEQQHQIVMTGIRNAYIHLAQKLTLAGTKVTQEAKDE